MAGLQLTYMGMPVLVSPQATKTEPVRPHIKGKHSPTYHRRISKKWLKRFGTKQVPCLYMVASHQVGVLSSPDTVVVHPALLDRVAEAAYYE